MPETGGSGCPDFLKSNRVHANQGAMDTGLGTM